MDKAWNGEELEGPVDGVHVSISSDTARVGHGKSRFLVRLKVGQVPSARVRAHHKCSVSQRCI